MVKCYKPGKAKVKCHIYTTQDAIDYIHGEICDFYAHGNIQLQVHPIVVPRSK